MPRPALPNKGLQRTAIGADKIGATLKPGIGPTIFPIYGCAAAEAQAVLRTATPPAKCPAHPVQPGGCLRIKDFR